MRLCLGVLGLVLIEQRQVVEALGNKGVFRAQDLFSDLESLIIEPLRLGVL